MRDQDSCIIKFLKRSLIEKFIEHELSITITITMKGNNHFCCLSL